MKPALSLLHAPGFEGPAEEFVRAFDHHRQSHSKDAVAEALKAFESTMKAICDARKWNYPSTAPAKELIKIMFDKGLIPPTLESEFNALRSLLESGVPTIRNKSGGHGQGSKPVTIPDHLAAYALHLTASNIVFLIESHKSTK